MDSAVPEIPNVHWALWLRALKRQNSMEVQKKVGLIVYFSVKGESTRWTYRMLIFLDLGRD